MKIRMIIAVTCTVLLVPAAAQARKAVYTATLKGGGQVSITAKQRERRGPIRIGTIRLRDIPSVCGDQTVPLGYTTGGSFGLGRDLEFDFEITDKAGAKLAISAKLSRRAKSFKGVVRLFGTFPSPNGPIRDCNSGERVFLAKPR